MYAMWRFSPKNEVVVSVKSNPGMHESSECGKQGLYEYQGEFSFGGAGSDKGEQARALCRNGWAIRMTVIADGRVVWEGNVGAGAMAFDGPVGIRSDNVRIELELFADEAGGGRAVARPACKAYTE